VSGWFVVNAREAQWRGGNDRTSVCSFERDEPFPHLGINVNVIEPGQLSTLYHAEDAQEDFLVLSGSCILLVEGEERPLGPWDFFHCPPGTPHALVAGSERCVVLPEDELARRHGAGVDRETSSVAEAYGERRRGPVAYGGWLD
jgi:quercetin dioxygenase-like cupin family protein